MSISEKNISVLEGFYFNNKTFVTKEELIKAGFDFSEFFSTSNIKQYFDIEENSFEYKDFKCGYFYVKTRDKNPDNPTQNARLFFQIIILEYPRLEAELKNAIDLLKKRKYTSGSAWAYRYESEMRDLAKADEFNIFAWSNIAHLTRIALNHAVLYVMFSVREI